MISTRNVNQLKFQKRLIRAAAQSPKVEAAHLFAIVARNLEEFLTVRVPLDGDTDAALSEYVELMELLIQAVARKFPTLYSDHQIDNIEALTLIEDEVDHALQSSLLSDEDRKEVIDGTFETPVRNRIAFNIVNELLLRGEPYPTMTQGGLFAYNRRFYHGYVWLMELAKDPVYGIVEHYLRTVIDDMNRKIAYRDTCRLPDCYRYVKNDMVPEIFRTTADAAAMWLALLKKLHICWMTHKVGAVPDTDLAVVPETHVVRLETIVAPEYQSKNQVEAYEAIRRWIQQKNAPQNTPMVMVTFQWSPYALMRNTDDTTGPIRLGSRSYMDPESGAAYNFCFEVDNPIVMNLPAVMETLTSKVNDYTGLVYEEDRGKVASFRGIECRTSAEPHDMMPLMMRGPIGIDHRSHTVIREVLRRLDSNGKVDGLFDQFVYNNSELCEFTTKDIRRLVDLPEVRYLVQKRFDNSGHFWVSEAFMTVYRVDEMPIMPNDSMKGEALAFILMMAALLKQRLHIYVECRARGDEDNNLRLVSMLRHFDADVRLVPSHKKFIGCKVHAKVWSFKVENAGTFDRLNLFSTGNFSTEAMRHFSDCYYIEKTSDLGNIAVNNFFRALFDGTEPMPYDARWSLYWVPREIRRKILDEIAWVTQNHRDCYGEGRIVVKVNHLLDGAICKALIEAADAGVEVVVVARTTCAIPTYCSENLTLKSFCGKVLEHDRLFIFSLWNRIDDMKDETHAYIGSADMMQRNLDRRIEFLKRVDSVESQILIDLLDEFIDEAESDPEVGFFVTRL